MSDARVITTGTEPKTDRAVSDQTSLRVVGIGASAGGLDATRKLLKALPATTGMAFILVQHLDPHHDSMLVDLLRVETALEVVEALDGTSLQAEHLYVIAPNTHLAIAGGSLRVTQPPSRHGSRLPFDFLLTSMAQQIGSQSLCVILSGTGTDGGIGAKRVKEAGGLVIVQDPDEAAFAGMPRNAIETGVAGRILAIQSMPEALLGHAARFPSAPRQGTTPDVGSDRVEPIIELLRKTTAHDFTLYKRGTLQRRIERRMGLSGLPPAEKTRYLEMLQAAPDEVALLATDLLINVTSFFRDREVFALLADEMIPRILAERDAKRPIRIWVAGCSSGEEVYTIAMLFHERIASEKREVKLQIFASDVDPEAIASAREGLYPTSIEADVSPERLTTFFIREDRGYRVSQDLRAAVVFTVQDVLTDPPFSRLDMIACRNLMIYLGPVAQAKVVSLFHFALRENGFLLLGTSETVGSHSRFEVVSKAHRLYRNTKSAHSSPVGLGVRTVDDVRPELRRHLTGTDPVGSSIADLGRKALMDAYAPAAVVIDGTNACLYHLGRTDDYLGQAAGPPNNDVLAMAREGLKPTLGVAIRKARKQGERVVVAGGSLMRNGLMFAVSIVAEPLPRAKNTLLVCFVESKGPIAARGKPGSRRQTMRVADLERELESTRADFLELIRELETSGEDQKIVNEEALSFNEEYQSTNEELITSKEELQSYNEELTALNGQLQETLDQQRTTSNDLQNVLFSTDVATLFLDTSLKIRFYTPATKALFSVIPGDVGRPLADLHPLATDPALLADARSVLAGTSQVEREIEAQDGAWFVRRILPYRAHGGAVEGVVVTFTDITLRKQTASALEDARHHAERATLAKSRFLAAASHDLRQPLQTLTLIQGRLANSVEGQSASQLVYGLGETLRTMGGMLNALLDVNRIEAGAVEPRRLPFPIGDIMDRLTDEFAYGAEAQGLTLRVVRCGLLVTSDPDLLEQMVRNLLSNAFKYTLEGTVLLGCRRADGHVRIEVWDTGSGIPTSELTKIFEEYNQIDNAALDRDRGLGLGLSIVRSLGNLLDHEIRVRSCPGRGSVFSIDVPLHTNAVILATTPANVGQEALDDGVHRRGSILVVEDDPNILALLVQLLEDDGHRTSSACDGPAALDAVLRGFTPDIVLADYNLPSGMDGLEVAASVQAISKRHVAIIVLSGDISTETLRAVAATDCARLNKPVRSEELLQVVQDLLPPTDPAEPSIAQTARAHAEPAVIIVVDDDEAVRSSVVNLFEANGHEALAYASSEAFLARYDPGREICLLIDAYLPGMNGVDLLHRLGKTGRMPPAIVITGYSDVAIAVAAMKAGALDFLEKPVAPGDLLAGVASALGRSRDAEQRSAWRTRATDHLSSLTRRQRQVLDLVIAGHPSKNIALDLGISRRTVENHRASIMRKTGSKSMPALARLAFASEVRPIEAKRDPTDKTTS